MDNKPLTRLLLISGLVALLVMSLLFDIVSEVLQLRNVEGAGLLPVIVVLFSILEIVIVLGGLGLFWYLFSSPERDRLVGWVFAIVGLLLTFAAPLLFFLPVPMEVYSLALYVSPGKFLFQSAAMLGVAGALSLMLKPAQVQE